MRGLKVALIILALVAFTASAGAFTMPSLFGSPASFPVLSMNINPIGTFSFGAGSGISSLSSTGSTPTIPIILGQPANSNQYMPVGFDSGFQMPGVGYQNSLTPTPVASIKPASTAYFNAPSLTQAQKEEAIKIASTSPLCEQYNAYPDESWNFNWGYPYDGYTITLSTIIGGTGGYAYSSNPNVPYGDLSFTVDLNSGKIVNGGFVDWRKYW